MTRKEMSEIFAALLLAYPNAEVFKGGIQKLRPTIELWTAALPEVDYWLGQRALIRVVRECKFPPSIAEFREAAKHEQADADNVCYTAWFLLTSQFDRSELESVETLRPTDPHTARAIEIMGGVQSLQRETAYLEFQAAYQKALRETKPLKLTPAAENVRRIGDKT